MGIVTGTSLAQENFAIDAPRYPYQASNNSVQEDQIKDLVRLAQQYFNAVCRDSGRGDVCYDYIDLKGEKDTEYGYRYVDFESYSDLVYDVQGSFQAPSLVLSEDFCNTLDQDAHFEFKKSKKTSSDCSWTVTNGMSSDTSVSVKVGVPTLAETSFSESISLNYASTQGQSVTHEDDWEIDNYIPVPAHYYSD